MSTLITGAAGFLGSHLADSLLAQGEAVMGLDPFDDFYARGTKTANVANAMGHEHFTLVEGDIRDADLLDALSDDIDSVVHLAARAGVRPSL
jgi:UDP-glucuronate 4-epimerase